MSLEDEEKKDFWDRGVTNHETAMRVGVPRVISYARQWNAIYFTGKYKTWTPLIIAGQHLGFVTPEMKSVIASFPQYFDVNQTSIALKAEFRTVDQRSAAIGSFVEALRVQRTPSDPYFRAFDFWRNEPYDVWGSRHDVPVLTMERSCLCLLGFRHYAVFLNGFVRHPERGLCIWFQQRSMNKTTWPGKWDIMVGGGTTPGNQIIESVIREACEEASLPLAVTDDRVRPAGCVSFFHQDARGVFPNVYHVFDLELGVDDRPVPGDGEAAEFRLLDAQQACDLVFSPRFKMTSRPVAVDFFVRHGILSPDKEPMYAELIEHLHAPMHVPFGCFHPLAIEDVDQSEGIESPSIDSVPV